MESKMKTHTQNGILSTLLLSTMLATPAMAAQVYDTSSFDGFYLGGNLGGSFTSARESSAVSSSFSSSIPTTFSATTANAFTHAITGAERKNRFAAGLYAGYGFVYCSEWYMGVEAFLNYSRYKTKTRRSLNLSSTFKNFFITLPVNFSDGISSRVRLQNYEGGADLRPGYFLAPCTLLYARLGVGYNKLKLHSSFNDNFLQVTTAGIALTPTITQALEKHKHKKLGSLRLGLGLEQNLCDNLSIRADYVNSSYRSVKTHVNQTFTNGTTSATFSHRVEIRRFCNNTVSLGMSYYW
jgi:opacity protein-like surface antigen